MGQTPRKPGELATALLLRLKERKCQNTVALARDLNASRKQVSNAAAQLARRGLLKRPKPGIYKLTLLGHSCDIGDLDFTSGPKAPHGKVPVHRDTFRERAWRSMRIRRRFTIGDVVSDAARDTETDARNNAIRYIGHLRRAGYVRDMPRRQAGSALTSNGFKVYLLVQDTGPRAPVWRNRAKCLHDFNIGKDVPCTVS